MIGIKLSSTKLRLSYWLNEKDSENNVFTLWSVSLSSVYHLMSSPIPARGGQHSLSDSPRLPSDSGQTWARSQLRFAASQPHLFLLCHTVPPPAG